ncbi:serine hydrolase [Cryptosporangium aurantiacum]|uniref:Beta-lactamase enzyme family protein n=1 Tax=Cryptosporangium aurantiacum TaxID=134849 RepID=A0A1M7JG80_9ACTN|nr:serine hydrolase [Cryptosporangium aurantiacum]SHM51956.1 Beta-lactamase enzyme family protein [Cryptosporangium aurantiacum]
MRVRLSICLLVTALVGGWFLTPAADHVARAAGCVDEATGFDCDFAARLERVNAYLATRPGYTGLAVSDGWRNRVWRNEYADRKIYAASTAKLAIALDILMRRHRGEVRLSTNDWRWLYTSLVASNNGAANQLWRRYGGASMVARWQDYGMTDTGFVPGLARHWGAMKTTAADLRRLTRYVVREAPSDVRQYLIARMRGVAGNQQWGVWAAGSGWVRGNKNGWFRYRAGWVINSAGFVGRRQRYLVAVMADQRSRGSYASGVETTSQVNRMLFRGL